jgi:hypothetical protein
MVSIENHPNIHAVGLMMDTLNAITKRRRGDALSLTDSELHTAVQQHVNRFVGSVDASLDEAVERKRLHGENPE